MKSKILIFVLFLNTIVFGQVINDEGNEKDIGVRIPSINAIVFANGKLRESIDPLSEVITTLYKNDVVKLIDYQSGYWIINIGDYTGYLPSRYITHTDEVNSFKRKFEKRREEMRRREEELEKGIMRSKDGLILPDLLKRGDENE